MTTLHAIERENLRRDLPPFRTGDTVRVHVKVSEGEKDRIQMFEGVVIRRRRGGASASFTVRKISYGVGVERVFPIESPTVAKVEIKSRGHVRRSRIYYLRELRGKKARLRSKVRDLTGLISDEDRDLRDGTAAAAEPEAPVVEEAPAVDEAPAEAEAPPEAVADEAPAEAPAEAAAEEKQGG